MSLLKNIKESAKEYFSRFTAGQWLALAAAVAVIIAAPITYHFGKLGLVPLVAICTLAGATIASVFVVNIKKA